MAWYQVKGNDADVVFSTRIRLARNLEGYPFGQRLNDAQRTEIIRRVGEALGNDYTANDLAAMSPLQREALVEQHLASREFAAAKGARTLFKNDGKSVSVMTPEEDHIRVQCILPGLALEDAYRFACETDDRLDAALPIAFDEKLGYLTHCLTNLGTGMRASVMLFLPTLTEQGAISSLAHQLSKLGLTMRGVYGEGSASHGSLYQISNQITLGLTEEEVLHKLSDAVQSISKRERELRAAVSGDAALLRADRIARAEGTARYATLLSSEEFFRIFSDLKLGISLGLIDSISHEALHALLIHTRPATLTLAATDTPKNGLERDRERAAFIKKAWEVARI
jgi:protein arginine kinase